MSEEFLMWVLVIAATYGALHYGSPAGHSDRYGWVEDNKWAMKVVVFTLVALAGITRLVVLHG